MGGSDTAPKADSTNTALAGMQNTQTAKQSSPVQDLLAKVQSGSMSLNDAIAQAKNSPVVDPYADQRAQATKAIADLSSKGDPMSKQMAADAQKSLDSLPKSSGAAADNGAALMQLAATDPVVGSMMAKDAVSKDQTLAGLFGQGGLQSQAEGNYGTASGNLASDRNALSGRDESYGLQDSDLKAYGQASGNVGRLFAGQEQNLAQSLADRGLAAGDSGAARQEFSGLAGNKNEQLAGLQQQIAQNRIQTAQGLAQARTNADLSEQAQSGNLANSLAQTGQQAIQDQYGRQLSGSEDQFNKQQAVANNTTQNQVAQQNVNNAQFAQQHRNDISPGQVLGAVGGIAGSALTGGLAGGLAKKPPVDPGGAANGNGPM